MGGCSVGVFGFGVRGSPFSEPQTPKLMERLGEIVDSIRDSQEFVELLRNKDRVNLEHVCDGAQAFVAACVARHHASRSCWIICPDMRRQEDVFNGLLNWQVPAFFFSELEIPSVEGAIPDPEIVAERLEVLRQLAQEKRTVVVVTIASLEDRVPAADTLRKQTVALKRSDIIDRDSLVESLLKSGYQRSTQVSARGQVAVRGGIIDIFSWHHSLPVRIELFDQRIDSIREFDLDDQTSIQILDRCEILVGEADHSTVRLQDFVRKADLVIGIELEAPQVEVCITSSAKLGEGIEDYTTAFFETGFHGFEAGDFLIEEAKRERALAQVRNWIEERWQLFAI